MLRYIPDGYEDFSEIVHEGKWAINIWKEKLFINIKSESYYIDQNNYLAFEFQSAEDKDDELKKTNFKSLSTASSKEWIEVVTFESKALIVYYKNISFQICWQFKLGASIIIWKSTLNIHICCRMNS